MNRVSVAQLRSALRVLSTTLGLPLEEFASKPGERPTRWNVGALSLDMANGGYRVEQIVGDGGSVRTLSPRGNARATLDYIHGMIDGANMARDPLPKHMRANPINGENDRRIETERKIVRRLIHEAVNAGWHPISVYDGGEHVRARSAKAALEIVFSVDESTITFQNARGERAGALIVLGNHYDVFADYNPKPGFTEAMERVSDYINALQARET